MKKHTLGFRARLSARLMTILGIGALTSSCEETINISCEYGTPYVKINVSGKVTDMNGQPIKGIRVSIKNGESPSRPALTQDDGKYSIEELMTGFGTEDITVLAEDIDGPENGGEFAPQEVAPQFKQTGEKPDGWFKGEFSSETDIKLIEK